MAAADLYLLLTVFFLCGLWAVFSLWPDCRHREGKALHIWFCIPGSSWLCLPALGFQEMTVKLNSTSRKYNVETMEGKQIVFKLQ